MTDYPSPVPSPSQPVPDGPHLAPSPVPRSKGGRGRDGEQGAERCSNPVPGTGVARGMAYAALADVITVLHASGRRTPCQSDPEPFFADDKATRTEAAVACMGCSVVGACGDYADAAGESWVWGGVDRGSHPFGQRRSGADVATALTGEVGS